MSEVFEQFADLIVEFVEFMASPFMALLSYWEAKKNDK